MPLPFIAEVNMTDYVELNLLGIEKERIRKNCKRVFGSCTDGSYEACLFYEGYYETEKKYYEVLNSDRDRLLEYSE